MRKLVQISTGHDAERLDAGEVYSTLIRAILINLCFDVQAVNDIVERVRLIEEYKDVLIDDEEQRKMILHCVVEETRKLYPDYKKSTLAKNN